MIEKGERGRGITAGRQGGVAVWGLGVGLRDNEQRERGRI